MAQNKKPKVDFSTALKAKADELTPKKPADSDEEFLANIDGEDVRFIRGDSSDEEWAAIKARPASTQRVTAKPAAGSGSPASVALATRKPNETDSEWRGRALNAEKHPRYDGTVETSEADQKEAKREQYKQLVQNEAYSGGSPESGALVTADELKLLRKMDPEHAADFLDERVKHREYADEQKNKPAPAAPAAKPEGERPVTSEDKFDNMQPEASIRGNAASKSNPFGAVGDLATTALPSTGSPMLDAMGEKVAPTEGGFPGASNPAPVSGGFPGLAGGDAGVAQANAKGEQNGAEDLAALGKLNDAAGKINQFNPMNPASWTQPVQNTSQGLEEFGADGAPLPGQPIPAGRNPDGTQKFDQVPGVDSPLAPSMGPGNVSASLGVKIPGAANLSKEDPQYMKRVDEGIASSKLRAGELADLQAANEVVQSGIQRQKDTARLDAEKSMNAEAQLASQARLTAISEAQRYNGARQSALDAAQKAAQTPTDPNRYWNNKDAGQKAAAVIAGALFGFTGQGMNWLQRIDGLIESDNRLQVADRNSKVQGLESQARGFGEAADFAMKAGASEAEAHVIAKQMKLESLNSYLQSMVEKSQNMQQKVVGQQMLMQVQDKMLGLDMQAKEMNGLETLRKNQMAIDQAKLSQGSAIASARLAASVAKSGKDGKRPPGVRVELAKIQAGLQAVKEARDAVGKGVSFTDQMSLNLGDALRAVGASGVANFVTPNVSGRTATADTAQENVLKAVKGENLLEADLSRALPRFKRPGLAANNNAWLDAQEQILQAKMNALLSNETEDGVNGDPMPQSADDFGFEASQ